MTDSSDPGPAFDGVTVGRPAARALLGAGYRSLVDLPDDLDALLGLHGVGHAAVAKLRAARSGRPPR
jgi:hypothetical protein